MMINNKELTSQMLDSVDVLREAVQTMYNYLQEGNYIGFHKLRCDFNELLTQLDEVVISLITQDNIFEEIHKGLLLNIEDCFQRINIYAKTRDGRIYNKLEFELLALLDELYLNLYYECEIKGDLKKQKRFNEGKGKILSTNAYIEEYHQKNQYKYDVSIIIIAYNNLEYTKKCISAVLENTPIEINYELILINHGSSDGTKEYFETIGCTKQIDLKNNGLGLPILRRIVEGKYVCTISNDVIVGVNYLENMIKCIESDPKIMWVVPTTTNVSNLQTIPCEFSNFEEMKGFCQKNNISDSYRWEQRVRLCNPIELTRSSDMFLPGGPGKAPISFRKIGFGDDIASLLIRRKGGKCILAKDAFCFHFGSVTVKEDKNYLNAEHIYSSRKNIISYYGVDPWGTGFCFSPELIAELPCDNRDSTSILGIGCGFGSNPLKIREAIKENKYNLDVQITNILLNQIYLEDVKSVSDIIYSAKNSQDIIKYIKNKQYDYIVMEEYPSSFDILELINKIKKSLLPCGYFCILINDENIRIKDYFYKKQCADGKSWVIIHENK